MSDQNIQPLFRLRVEYAKKGRLAYLGHLEVIHTIERIVRRAGLPYAVTQGFSPHMRVGFSSALPVGTASRSEWYDLFMTELVDPADALERLKAASPEDLMARRCGYIDVRTPALTAQVTRVGYRVGIRLSDGAGVDADALASALDTVRDLGRIPYIRGKKTKVMDVAKTLVSYEVTALPVEGVDLVLSLDTYCDNEGALRPEILLCALDRALGSRLDLEEDPITSTGIPELRSMDRVYVERTWQRVEGSDGALLDPLDR